jgi:hypothetical protein
MSNWKLVKLGKKGHASGTTSGTILWKSFNHADIFQHAGYHQDKDRTKFACHERWAIILEFHFYPNKMKPYYISRIIVIKMWINNSTRTKNLNIISSTGRWTPPTPRDVQIRQVPNLRKIAWSNAGGEKELHIYAVDFQKKPNWKIIYTWKIIIS